MSKRKGTDRRSTGLAAAALLLLLPLGPAGAQSPQVPPPEKKPAGLDIPLPQRNPAREPEEAEEPETPPHPGEVEVPDWTPEQVAAARAECDTLLADLDAEYETLEPIREGRCGAPYPVRVASIGAAPAVEIEPPATLTCEMTAALGRWLSGTVQTAAREKLGTPVIRLRNISSYVCRRRYSDPETRISEHALANALDIAGFTMESEKTVTLLDHWSAMTPREEPLAEEESEEESEEDEPETVESTADTSDPALGTDQPQPASARRTGAGKTEETAAPPPEPKPAMAPAPEQRFLRALHAGACEIFGTVLGPEANAAHRDHFHLDMKERDYGSYCE